MAVLFGGPLVKERLDRSLFALTDDDHRYGCGDLEGHDFTEVPHSESEGREDFFEVFAVFSEGGDGEGLICFSVLDSKESEVGVVLVCNGEFPCSREVL